MIKKKSGKISKTQVFAIILMVVGYALGEAIKHDLIPPEVASWGISVSGFILMILRSYTSEPIMTVEESRFNKAMKDVMKSSLVLFVVSCVHVELDCKDKDILVELSEKKVVAKCSDGSHVVTLTGAGGVVGAPSSGTKSP